MFETNDFRKGLKVEIDGEPYIIVDFQHVKPGKGNAFTRTRFKNLISGNVLDRTLKSGEKVGKPDLDQRDCTYLYNDGDHWTFMDADTFEQFVVDQGSLGDAPNYLLENAKCSLLMFKGKAISVDLPTFVELKVTDAPPAVKGDTAQGGTKPVTLETGYLVFVPMHISEGDTLKIDTRDGHYVEKVNR